jgi:hypothetical protein
VQAPDRLYPGPVPAEGVDPRAAALGAYLRQRAAAFSMSADVNDEQHVAAAGMALLDAADLAEGMRSEDQRLLSLSEAGCFETMPKGGAVFVETDAIRAAIQRPLVGTAMSGSEILTLVVAASGDR